MPLKGEPPADALEGADAVINLAGEPVAQKWSAAAKQKIRESRIVGTARLIQALSTISQRPTVLVSASAVGIYGARGDEVLTETSPPGTGFLAEVCREWEKEADMAESLRHARGEDPDRHRARQERRRAGENAAGLPQFRRRQTGVRQAMDVVDPPAGSRRPVQISRWRIRCAACSTGRRRIR